jgi:hypothetical protein
VLLLPAPALFEPRFHAFDVHHGRTPMQ